MAPIVAVITGVVGFLLGMGVSGLIVQSSKRRKFYLVYLGFLLGFIAGIVFITAPTQ